MKYIIIFLITMMCHIDAQENVTVTAIDPPAESKNAADVLYVCICSLADVEGELKFKKQKIMISRSDVLTRPLVKWPIENGTVNGFVYYGNNEFYGSQILAKIENYRIIQTPGLVNLKKVNGALANQDAKLVVANAYNAINKKYPGVFSSFIATTPETNDTLWYFQYPPKIDQPLDVTNLVLEYSQENRPKK